MSTPRTIPRFASLIRVSTEQQADMGESLGTQRAQNEKDVEQLGGTIVEWYGGQEHGTPGHEKKEVDRLIADAKKGKFEAVIVANADRWSRDNQKSQDGLEIFKRGKIRFFVGTTEYDLFKPEHCLFLGMSAVIGRFQAQHQNKKSLENRINRARRGRPTCGKLPFGRTFNKHTEKWGIDQQKQAMIHDVANRYLAGEPLAKLAERYGVNHSNLHKILTKGCGDTWEQEFRSDDLNILEVVPTKIPRLLPEAMINAIRQRAEQNRTFRREQPKHQYLFGRFVFCSHCGYAMTSQTNHNGKRYYRHAARVQCVRGGIKAWVNADDLEQAVFRDLFRCFGNPIAVQQAIEKATPNLDQVNDYRLRHGELETELARFKDSKSRIIDLVTDGTILKEEAASKLEDVRRRITNLQAELDRLNAKLDNVPNSEAIKAAADKISKGFRQQMPASVWAATVKANVRREEMTWEERRELAVMVFSGKTPERKRMGIFLEWVPGQEERRQKTWKYRIFGHFIDERGTSPCPIPFDNEESGGHRQRELLKLVSESASCSPARGLPSRHFFGWRRPPGA